MILINKILHSIIKITKLIIFTTNNVVRNIIYSADIKKNHKNHHID